jgi:MFS transporter, FSR family, fosmidomycin resistance protein
MTAAASRLTSYSPAILMGMAHALSDCCAGYLVWQLPDSGAWLPAAGMLLLYNVLAFGGQLPAGMWLDRFADARTVAVASLLLMACALVIVPLSGLLAVLLAGMGSALFHVAGGSIAMQALPAQAGGIGVFAAPGVTGLALGGWLAWLQIGVTPWLVVGLGLLAVCVWVAVPRQAGAPASLPRASAESAFDRHDMWMALLLLAIGLRSAVWNLVELLQGREQDLLIAVAVAATLGKLAGGFLADWIGWRRYALIALALAAPLLSLGAERPWLFLPGVALLQSATPACLAMMRRFLPGQSGTATGLCLGLAVALGGIPFLMGMQPGPWLLWLGPMLVLGMIAALRLRGG